MADIPEIPEDLKEVKVDLHKLLFDLQAQIYRNSAKLDIMMRELAYDIADGDENEKQKLTNQWIDEIDRYAQEDVIEFLRQVKELNEMEED
jgi:adenylosuccinate lyase